MTDHWRNERMMRRGSGFSEFMSDTMRNRPEALLLMAAGAALLMTKGRGFGLSDLVSGAREMTHFDEGVQAVADTASQAASNVSERVGAQVEGLRDTVGDYAERAAQTVQESGEAFMDTASETYERARSTLQDNFDYMAREQPLMLGALGLVAGAAIGAALPRTLFERDAMRFVRQPSRTGMGRRERLRSGASETGRSGMGQTSPGQTSEVGQRQQHETQTGGRTGGSSTSSSSSSTTRTP